MLILTIVCVSARLLYKAVLYSTFSYILKYYFEKKIFVFFHDRTCIVKKGGYVRELFNINNHNGHNRINEC